jgi:hypothetical protein
MSIFALPANSKIVHQHGKISTVLSLPTFYQSVVQFINSFGNLYYGTMNTELFYKLFKSSKQTFLSALKNIDLVQTTQPVAFKLYLCRIAMKESWQLPALINQAGLNLNWNTGQGRFLATGMCFSEPHLRLKFLLLQNKNTPPEQFLQDPTLISTDQQLHEILNLSSNSADNIELEFQLEQNGSQLFLASLYNGNQSHHYDVGAIYLEQFKSWQQSYGPRPTLHVYTDWPELIIDSENVWTICHQGNSTITKTDDFKLGYLELELFNQIENPVHGSDHVLYITEPRLIDVSDLLCWVDLTYSAYISCHGQFALFRPDNNYVSTLIDISYSNKYSHE